jgi:hypothetical protein
MYAVRLWSVRHARGLNAFYRGFESVLKRMHPLFKALGYERIERPVAAVERTVKGILFDCRMCGQCVLSSTGMSCPMTKVQFAVDQRLAGRSAWLRLVRDQHPEIVAPSVKSDAARPKTGAS